MDPDYLLLFFGRVVIATMVIPIIAAMARWHFFTKKLKIFFFFCLVTFLLSITEIVLIWHVRKYYPTFWKPILTYLEIKDTNFFQILFHLRDFLLLGWFYSKVLAPQKVSNWVGKGAVILSAMSIVNYIFVEGYSEPGLFNPTADAVFSFVVPMIGLWYIYHGASKIDMYKNPVFWISIGLILPNLLGLFMFFTADFIQKEDFELYVKLMIFTNFFQIIGIILITIGFAHAYYMRFFYPESTK